MNKGERKTNNKTKKKEKIINNKLEIITICICIK